MKLTKIGALSLGYALAIFAVISSFFQVLSSKLASANPDVAAQLNPMLLTIINAYGWWAVLILPIVAAIAALIGGIIIAAIYNFIVVKITGGIKIEMHDGKK